jgi:hypothetical protein
MGSVVIPLFAVGCAPIQPVNEYVASDGDAWAHETKIPRVILRIVLAERRGLNDYLLGRRGLNEKRPLSRSL